MIIHVSENGYDQKIEVRKTNFIINVEDEKGFYIPCRLYLFDKSSYIKPVIYFCNNEVCLFCENKPQNPLNWKALSHYGQVLYDFYRYIFLSRNYKNNFEQYSFGDKTYKIKWIESDDYSFQFNDKKKELVVHYQDTHSRSEYMTDILRQLETQHTLDLVVHYAKEMGILERFVNIFIDDPTQTLPDPSYCDMNTKEIGVGVSGTSYNTDKRDVWTSDKNNGLRKCTLVLSPLILYETEVFKRILIVHELVHIKIGMNHAHDQYFWYCFTKYSKIEKKYDNSYSQKQEWEDTEEYDAKYRRGGKTVKELITKDWKKCYKLEKKQMKKANKQK